MRHRIRILAILGVFWITSPAHAANVIIIPPDVVYLNGANFSKKEVSQCTAKKACQKAACRSYCTWKSKKRSYANRVLSDLGRDLYCAISNGIADFNNLPESVEKGFSEKVVTAALPSWKYNDAIHSFYKGVCSNDTRLIQVCQKRGADTLIWISFTDKSQKHLTRAARKGATGPLDLDLVLHIFNGKIKTSSPLTLTYSFSYGTLTEPSREILSNKIKGYFQGRHLSQATPEETGDLR